MDYRKIGETYYVRIDRDEEIISTIISICRDNGVDSAIYSGIGGCSTAEIQTFVPAKRSFETEVLEGMLELISINGNILKDEKGEYVHHSHAMYSYKKDGEHHISGGHMKASKVLYTAEIELRPVIGGSIHKKFDPETGTGFWDFE